MLRIQGPPGTIVPADDLAEIQDVLPFRLVLPENLPLDLRLSRVSVHLPPEVLEPKDLNTRVVLGFRNENGTVAFELHESLVSPRMDSPGIRSIRQDDTVVKAVSNEERERISAVWERCDIGFFLTGGPPEQLSGANLLWIVESTLACQGVG
jgi:hypothetical protein